MQYLKSTRFLILLFFVFTMVIGCIAMISATRTSALRQSLQNDATSAEAIASAEGADSGNGRIIRAHEERIGVFKLNGELEYMIDVYLITLPDADQRLLTNGIYISDPKQLDAFIEDYTG